MLHDFLNDSNCLYKKVLDTWHLSTYGSFLGFIPSYRILPKQKINFRQDIIDF